MPFCSGCGKEIARDAVICPNCGKKFTSGFAARLPFLIAGIVGVFLIAIIVIARPTMTGFASGCTVIETEDVQTFVEQEPYNDFETKLVPLRYYPEVAVDKSAWFNFIYHTIVNARIKNIDETEGTFTFVAKFNDSGNVTETKEIHSIPPGETRLFHFKYDENETDKDVLFSYEIEPEKIPVQKDVTKLRNTTKLKPVKINKTVCA